MKIKVVIIDDEKAVRTLIASLIMKNLNNVLDIVGEADDVKTGISLIKEKQPDLIFLDIKMKSGTGFDLLEKLRGTYPEVIFITAYDQFAVNAFKFSAIDYLMKPISLIELKHAVEKFQHRFPISKTDRDHRLKVLINNYNGEDKTKSICIRDLDGFSVVRIKDIVRLESDNNYTHFFTCSGKKLTTSRTIKDYETSLADFGFYRIHQRHIINLSFVSKFIKGESGRVLLTDGSDLPIARQRKAGFINKFI